jgi:DNA-binding NarL/FixJ family response regulator
MRLVGVASDCDDALRLILMTCPDIIILPWSAMAANLIRAIERLRDRRFSPRVVVVTPPPAALEGHLLPAGVTAIAVDALHPERLTEALCAVLADPLG